MLDGIEWLDLSSYCFIPGKQCPVPNEQEGCQGRALPNTLEKRMRPWSTVHCSFVVYPLHSADRTEAPVITLRGTWNRYLIPVTSKL